ncbi:MAG: hypothetical protein A2359_03280 [Candidatus Moranbacteria bacterium RIFOXYB1_FULL_43_19]|nr:MAG: hypothetical protein A2359_03280 [Candidatus Moranbacteria bacterium RIFOXYB1_FULL_43_19]OGI28389.1 MAG: hypothetical protein A2184_01725 [Candidatus Moranbacteria bacterium RIFOXYA1_FULL_44_7]OGI32565.1 MAG: hypothetical protein A2420_03255 [Candidatus Moranbacteria bacterium RIFOXYC1_FULL_44_13]OGI38118.1 MAG: hypothetical protein A2612_02150 [Candidatus Moranbacteria bacterium RIFOXYD1_FULL_44_12]
MNQEELKKNFVLLSKIAKEKKYAQEYLGLLARRGDIGSIRIGKRWYTTTEWFSEFLRDAEARKEETKTVNAFLIRPAEESIEKIEINRVEKTAIPENIFQPLVETEKIPEQLQEKKENEEGKVNLKIASLGQEKPIQKRNEAASLENEEVKIILPKTIKAEPVSPKYFAPAKKLETINLRAQRNARPMLRKMTPDASAPKINMPKGEIRIPVPRNFSNIENRKTRPEDLSPNFVPVFSKGGFFPKFAFAMSGVLLLFLLIEIGWVYRNELKNMVSAGSGIVAGAEDNKTGLDIVRKSSADYFDSREGKLKENISLSRVLIRAAMEKNSE